MYRRQQMSAFFGIVGLSAREVRLSALRKRPNHQLEVLAPKWEKPDYTGLGLDLYWLKCKILIFCGMAIRFSLSRSESPS